MAGYGKARDLTLVEHFGTSYGLAATVASFILECQKKRSIFLTTRNQSKSGGVKTPPARERRRPAL